MIPFIIMQNQMIYYTIKVISTQYNTIKIETSKVMVGQSIGIWAGPSLLNSKTLTGLTIFKYPIKTHEEVFEKDITIK